MLHTIELQRELCQLQATDTEPITNSHTAMTYVDEIRNVNMRIGLSPDDYEFKLRAGLTDGTGRFQVAMNSGDARAGTYHTKFVVAGLVGRPAVECAVNFGYRNVTKAGGLWIAGEEGSIVQEFKLGLKGLVLVRNCIKEWREEGRFVVSEPIYPFQGLSLPA